VKENINSFLTKMNKKIKLPLEERLSSAVASLTKKEQLVFLFFVLLLVVSVFGLLWKVNQSFIVKVPAKGGSLTEGVIGTPRFINPLFAISDADRDVTALVYSGLMRATDGGTLIPDIAKSYSVSEDGLKYTFILKSNALWQDGEPITADDVVFTVQKAQDSTLRSTKRASWDGITVEKINNKEVEFTLQRPYAPFLENTTMGILPKHIWKDIDTEQFNVPSKYNIKPIGSGPYKIAGIKKDKDGIPKYYDFIPFKKYALGEPYISKIRIRFYSNIDILLKEFNNGQIESMHSISPQSAKQLTSEGNFVKDTPLPRVFGVFFNQNQAKIFTDKTVRKALNSAVDKKDIINKILYGYATAIDSPIPPGALGYDGPINDDEFATPNERIAYSRGLLEEAGWKFDEDKNVMVKETKKETSELAFSISTSDVPELKEVAEMLKEQWEKIGARVDVKIFEIGSLNQNVIRPRKYDALLFGEIVGRGSDLFAFWHSSQRLDPGLNIAMYANITADKLLEDARGIENIDKRIKKYKEFQNEVRSDVPAIFLYSPDFIYVLPKKIKGVELENVTTPSERFLNIANWYIETDNVWKIFVNKQPVGTN
jgi:peptide/nickel transport system substrate-binding protein